MGTRVNKQIARLLFNKEQVSLQKIYPLSKLLVIKKSLKLYLPICLIWCLIGIVYYLILQDQIAISRKIFFNAVGIFFLLSIILITVKSLYEYTSLFFYRYSISEGNLKISKGIIYKHGASFPLSKITDIYFDQDLIDAIFGLSDLHFTTPTIESSHFARITGLKNQNAIALRHLIEELARESRISENSTSERTSSKIQGIKQKLR